MILLFCAFCAGIGLTLYKTNCDKKHKKMRLKRIVMVVLVSPFVIAGKMLIHFIEFIQKYISFNEK